MAFVYNTFGARPIYLSHVRKTGGTSLNFSFFALASSDPESIWTKMREDGAEIVDVGDYRFVTRNKEHIEAGRYSYAHSHIPFHELDLRDNVFTVCALRDPVDRIRSHYRMVRSNLASGVQKRWLETEKTWMGDSVVDFCRNMPGERREAQLRCFSKDGNIKEAVDLAMTVDHLFDFHQFTRSLNALSEKLGVKMRVFHQRKTTEDRISSSELTELRDLLSEEILFYDAVKSHLQ